MTDQLTPTQRRQISQLGGLRSAQTSDPHARGYASVRAKRQRCYDATDASLPESERQRLADLAYREQLARVRLARGKGSR
jgi:hypothetical protein